MVLVNKALLISTEMPRPYSELSCRIPWLLTGWLGFSVYPAVATPAALASFLPRSSQMLFPVLQQMAESAYLTCSGTAPASLPGWKLHPLVHLLASQ